ncbi:MAG: NAD-dependent dihydropyrimidine dehydrogenase subunit PreA [Clostridia bacterium]|nr:NAD-dependent dihydropyrimidine dehydrogenase subunit PreA [Clostridia bacterium]
MIKINEEAAGCLLCQDGACTRACTSGLDPARIIRALRFENMSGAAQRADANLCAGCEAPCEKACIHYDRPVRIKEMLSTLPKAEEVKKADLSVDFMGVHCESPFFLSSSIVAGSYEMCASAFEAGWAGAVFKTIGFIKPEEVSPRFDAVGKEGTPFIGFKNLEQISDHDLSENLEAIRKLKKNYPGKVVVASIMGQSDTEWRQLAKLVTEAGADIIECNFSCPHMTGHGLGSDVGQNPELVAQYTRAVRQGTNLPVLAKMTPNIGNMEIPAMATVEAGADGLAAINTIKSITGLDLDSLEPRMSVGGKSSVSGYSGKAVKPIALRFIHDMAKCPSLEGVPISGMGGIETWADAAEFIALGCQNIQITTAVMQYGYRIIDDLKEGLACYLAKKGLTSVDELVGSALGSMVSPDSLDRKTVVYPVTDKEKCVGCGRCFISCTDAGHQAIKMENGRPKLDGRKCVGCHLCTLVCPVSAIGISKRTNKTH